MIESKTFPPSHPRLPLHSIFKPIFCFRTSCHIFLTYQMHSAKRLRVRSLALDISRWFRRQAHTTLFILHVIVLQAPCNVIMIPVSLARHPVTHSTEKVLVGVVDTIGCRLGGVGFAAAIVLQNNSHGIKERGQYRRMNAVRDIAKLRKSNL